MAKQRERAWNTEGERHGVTREAVPAKLVCGIIACSARDMERAERVLEEAFGKIELRSERVPFNETPYYQREMGDELVREWTSFEDLVPQDTIVDAKLTTNALENRLARPDGARSANLDPGYIVASRLVLATTKDYAHRIYLGKGTYAEVALVYRAGSFRPLEWTYPEYQKPVALDFFTKVRTTYLAQLHASS